MEMSFFSWFTQKIFPEKENCLSCNKSLRKSDLTQIWYSFEENGIEGQSCVYMCSPCLKDAEEFVEQEVRRNITEDESY